MKKTQIFLACSALALSVSVGANGAWARTPGTVTDPSGHRFCDNGTVDNHDIAGRIRNAQKADPSGLKINVEGCRVSVAYFLQTILHGNPEAKVNGVPVTSVAQVADYYDHELVEADVDKDTLFDSACVWKTPDGMRVRPGCMPRGLRPGEKVYKDKNNGVLMLLTSCVNGDVIIVNEVTVQPCVQVRTPPLGLGISIRAAYIGPAPLPGRCYKLVLSDGTEFVGEFPKECKNDHEITLSDGRIAAVNCDWRAVEQRVRQYLHNDKVHVQNVSFSFVARTSDGQDVTYLPVEVKDGVFAVCWEVTQRTVLPSGRVLEPGTVLTVGVVAEDFVGPKSDTATVTIEHALTIGAQH